MGDQSTARWPVAPQPAADSKQELATVVTQVTECRSWPTMAGRQPSDGRNAPAAACCSVLPSLSIKEACFGTFWRFVGGDL